MLTLNFISAVEQDSLIDAQSFFNPEKSTFQSPFNGK